MTPLTQQLKDKKKEQYFINICPNCKKQIYGDEDGRCCFCSELLILNGKAICNTEFEVVKKEELEQAIAEKKEFIRLLKERIPDNLEGGHTHEVIDELARDKWL